MKTFVALLFNVWFWCGLVFVLIVIQYFWGTPPKPKKISKFFIDHEKTIETDYPLWRYFGSTAKSALSAIYRQSRAIRILFVLRGDMDKAGSSSDGRAHDVLETVVSLVDYSIHAYVDQASPERTDHEN